MSAFELACPLPPATSREILLGHGSGGTLSARLIRDVFLPVFHNPILAKLDDQAVLSVDGLRLAFTTDSFVVKPLFFPGGDIGSLAVHGTVNDLAMGGARPLYLSAAFILEEGLPIETLRRVVLSLQSAAASSGVMVVTADTKVVERGKADGLYITTTGIGAVYEGVNVSADQARPGDAVLLSGSVGDHGIAVLSQREGIEFECAVRSDSAPLHELVGTIIGATRDIHCLRDPTRGGLASTLNEIAARSQVGIEIDEPRVPVRDEVRNACELLGFDPLYVANEGKLVAFVEPAVAETVLSAMRTHPLGKDAQMIGTVTTEHAGLVTMRTAFGASRIVDMLPGDLLPRIC